MLCPSALDDIPRALAAMRSLVAHKAGLLHCLRKCRGQEELEAAVNSVVGAAGIIRMASLQPSVQERECLAFCALVLGKLSCSSFGQTCHRLAPTLSGHHCRLSHRHHCGLVQPPVVAVSGSDALSDVPAHLDHWRQ